jgi:hypothetical protein
MSADVNVKIGATDATGAAFRSAEQKMKAFSGMAKGAMGALGVGVGVAGIASAIKGAIDYGGAVSDAAVATQTGVESLQVFRYAATQAGAKVEQMDKALISLNNSGVEAANGSATATRAFDSLGIKVSEFNKLPTEKKFELIAQQVAGAKDQNVAMSDAMDIMGSKNAPKLMEVLQSLGKDGFGAMEAGARSAGQVMDEELAARLAAAGDSIDRFKTGATIKIGEALSFWADAGSKMGKIAGDFFGLFGSGDEGIFRKKSVSDTIPSQYTDQFYEAIAANKKLQKDFEDTQKKKTDLGGAAALLGEGESNKAAAPEKTAAQKTPAAQDTAMGNLNALQAGSIAAASAINSFMTKKDDKSIERDQLSVLERIETGISALVNKNDEVVSL